jgi:hypothetical protein
VEGAKEAPLPAERRRRKRRRPEQASPSAPPQPSAHASAPAQPEAPPVNNAVLWHVDKSALPLSEPRRYRDRAHLEFVASQPCLLCGRQPSDAHHLRFMQPRAMGRPDACRGRAPRLQWSRVIAAGADPLLPPDRKSGWRRVRATCSLQCHVVEADRSDLAAAWRHPTPVNCFLEGGPAGRAPRGTEGRGRVSHCAVQIAPADRQAPIGAGPTRWHAGRSALRIEGSQHFTVSLLGGRAPGPAAGHRHSFRHILCNRGAGPDGRTRANAAVSKDCPIGANESIFADSTVP